MPATISPRSIADAVVAVGGPAPLLYTAAAVTIVGNGLSNVVAGQIGPVTGYQYVQAGGKCMDNAMATLCDKVKGGAIHPLTRSNSLAVYDNLRRVRIDLENDTQTYAGSARNWSKGRNYYHAAYELDNDTTRISTEYLIKQARENAAKEIEELEATQSTERRRTVTTPAQNETVEPAVSSDVRFINDDSQEAHSSSQRQDEHAQQSLASVEVESHHLPILYPPETATVQP